MRALRSARTFLVLTATAAFGWSANLAHAVILELVVTPQSAPGASFDVAVRVSDLGDGAAPSLGTFDINVSYDPDLLASPSVVFGDPVLGDQLDLFGLGAIGPTATPSLSSINLFEVSLDPAEDLDTVQVGAFTLATLTFAPLLTAGTSPLELTVNALGDAQGDPFAATLIDASVDVRPIPEPATWTLLAIGLGLGMLVCRGRLRARPGNAYNAPAPRSYPA